MDGTKYDTHHSHKVFGLLRTARTVISPPEEKKHIVDNPGGNGNIDLSTSLTGVPLYHNRTITESFIIPFVRNKSEKILSKIYQLLDGQLTRIVFDSEPDYYWLGKPMVSGVDKSNETHMVLNIVSDVEPFKYERFSSTEDWEWDSFNFETGIIRDYRDIYVGGELAVEIIGTKMPVSPVFRTSEVLQDMLVEYYDPLLDRTVEASLLDTTTPDIIIREGAQKLKFTGTGYVTIEYRGGIL